MSIETQIQMRGLKPMPMSALGLAQNGGSWQADGVEAEKKLTTSSETASAATAGKAGADKAAADAAKSDSSKATGKSDAAKADQAEEDEDGFTFADLLDIVNPLQHIPVVSTVYRELTGDKIGDTARLLGGALFGGPIGLALAGADFAVKEVTGSYTDEHIVAVLESSDEAKAAAGGTAAGTTATALATPAATGSSPAGASAPDKAQPFTANKAAAEKAHRLYNVNQAHGDAAGKVDIGTVQVDGPAAAMPADARAPAAPAPESSPLPLGMMDGSTTNGSTTNGNAAGSSGAAAGEKTNGAIAPSPEALRQAMDAQGISSSDHPLLKNAATSKPAGQKMPHLSKTDSINAASSPTARPQVRPADSRSADSRSAAQATEAPAQPAEAAAATAAPVTLAPSAEAQAVPTWFDNAMKKAMDAYQKTGRLSPPANGTASVAASGETTSNSTP